MQELDIAAVLHSGMLTTLKLCTPLLLAPLVAGLLVALVQAVTQISDSSLSFLPKLISTGAAAWVAGPFLSRTLLGFMTDLLDKLVAIGGQ